MILSFRQNGPVAVPINTRFGCLYFYLGQALEAEAFENGRHRLRTRQYWYRVQEEPELTAKALMRWEYVSDTPRDSFCRHHAQLPINLPLGGRSLSLDKAHLPTGWVTMEEVIRFLIIDLGLRPPCGDEWPAKLEESEKKFFEEFTSKR